MHWMCQLVLHLSAVRKKCRDVHMHCMVMGRLQLQLWPESCMEAALLLQRGGTGNLIHKCNVVLDIATGHVYSQEYYGTSPCGKRATCSHDSVAKTTFPPTAQCIWTSQHIFPNNTKAVVQHQLAHPSSLSPLVTKQLYIHPFDEYCGA